MDIIISGSGSQKRRMLERVTRNLVEDITEIMKYGVLFTPAMVIDANVRSYGRVPSQDENKEVLTQKP